MALGILSGFKVTRVATTADTTITPCYYVVARVSAGAVAAVCSVFNGTTAVANKVIELSAAANGADECGFPVRTDAGFVKVQLTPNTAEAFIGVR